MSRFGTVTVPQMEAWLSHILLWDGWDIELLIEGYYI